MLLRDGDAEVGIGRSVGIVQKTVVACRMRSTWAVGACEAGITASYSLLQLFWCWQSQGFFTGRSAARIAFAPARDRANTTTAATDRDRAEYRQYHQSHCAPSNDQLDHITVQHRPLWSPEQDQSLVLFPDRCTSIRIIAQCAVLALLIAGGCAASPSDDLDLAVEVQPDDLAVDPDASFVLQDIATMSDLTQPACQAGAGQPCCPATPAEAAQLPDPPAGIPKGIGRCSAGLACAGALCAARSSCKDGSFNAGTSAIYVIYCVGL